MNTPRAAMNIVIPGLSITSSRGNFFKGYIQ